MAETQNRKRERGANYTAEEKTLFADLVTQYKHIVEDKRTGGIFIQRKKYAWKAITDKYNSNCCTGRRKIDQLKALYDNMKQKARKNIGESNIQMNKTDGGCYKPKTIDSDSKILAIIQDQVKPLHPFNSGALYFKDSGNTLDTEIARCEDSPMVTLTQEADVTDVRRNEPNQAKRKVLKTEYGKKQKDPVLQNPRINSSSEQLKRIYFRKKCHNANLERKKLLHEIIQNKEQHRLKMLILKKKMENMS